MNYELLVIDHEITNHPRCRCFDGLRTAGASTPCTLPRPPAPSLKQGRPGSSTPGRGNQDHASTGPGAAMDAVAGVPLRRAPYVARARGPGDQNHASRGPCVDVSPYVEPMIPRSFGTGTFGCVVLARDLGDDGIQRGDDAVLKVAKSGMITRKKILWDATCLRHVAHARHLVH